MRLKKLKTFITAGLICLMAQETAFAYDMMWFDRSAGIDTFQKVVVYPMADGGRNNFFPTLMLPYSEYNYQLHKRLTRHAKGITYYELFDMKREKENMLEIIDEATRERLLQPFPDEASRAAAITDAFMADGYIVPYFRARETKIDHSPGVYVNVYMYAYTQVENAPNSKYNGTIDYKKDESFWTETTYVPPADLTRYITALEFTMYNGDGQKIFTCLNRRHSYTDDFDDQYKDMKDDFADDLKDIKKNKEVLKHQQKNSSTLKVRIGNLVLPANVNNDDYKLKSCWYIFKTHLLRMKNMKLVEGDEASQARYYVDGNVSRYDFTPKWREPYAESITMLQWTKEQKWTDTDGNEHTMKIRRYEPSIIHHHGKYLFNNASRVVASLTMYDTKTGKAIISKSYDEIDDKEVDCMTHIMEDFCKEAEKYAKNRLKK